MKDTHQPDEKDVKALRDEPAPAMAAAQPKAASGQPSGDEAVTTKLRFDEGVIQKIVGKTAAEVDGILDLHGNIFADMTDRFRKTDNLKKGVSVDVEDNQRVSVALEAVMAYGTKAPAVFDKVTEEICAAVKEMTGMDVVEVTLTVKDMLTDEELQAQRDAAQQDEAEATAKTPQPA
ncbi:Asp23/Gls24 family envelope stress response protein [Lacticaseibacillus daqingensis]|uniref:Asp23/Gls24 family envelope stress response protein n=1 Tax=Lacticaseibacillus daqingensis TaxID=2486014 RepID=UPI001CDC9344|nr:Asp23/Gls24 family envelope stress response protein [Lacticaseibacillus daqingensis]